MTTALEHRGPDDAGAFHDTRGRVFLGHRRLSIVDLDGGRQPMSDAEQSIYVVFNGEIYNHRALRAELEARGHRFQTDHSDTEVLIHGYKEWGSELPNRLNGMFAFAIYDRAKEVLFLARDRFGEKPCFVCATPDGFAFASELKAILVHPYVPREISRRGMSKLFALGFIPAPSTIMEGVFKLAPGHHLTLDTRTFRYDITPYWKFRIKAGSHKIADVEREEQLRVLVSKAVERRLMSDVPLGVFLSGGIDSSVVLAAVAEHRAPEDIHTFSLGFNEASFDESGYARSVATYFSSRHHEERLCAQTARDLLEVVLGKLDEPLGDPSILPTYLLARFARQEVKVVLGGDGADELFAGYDPFLALGASRMYNRVVPQLVHRAARRLIDGLGSSERNMSLEFVVKRTLRGLSYPMELWNAVWLGPLDPDGLRSLFKGSVSTAEAYEDVVETWRGTGSERLVDRTLEFYTKLYLPNDILTKVDRASMMNSLEARAPFLDNDLVAFAETLPSECKLHRYTTKALLRSAFKGRIPDAVIRRRKKGFGIPLAAWLREWKDVSFLESLPYIDREWLKLRWDEHQLGVADHRQLLWCAISLDRFMRNLPQAIH